MIGRWSRTMHWWNWWSWQAALPVLLGMCVFVGALAVYTRTAAPSVMAGDSAEFQFAAPLLGVPHPTGYPLYILLGKMATLGHPRDVAHRVTLVSSVDGAAAAALLALLTLRISRSTLAGLIAGIAVATSPGLWNAATMAEVYALNALLMVLLAWTLWKATDQRPPTTDHRPWLYASAFVTGLGISHHGSFAFIAAPLFLGYGMLPLWLHTWQQWKNDRARLLAFSVQRLAFSLLFGLLGLAPWLFILVQYARFGPFNGLDYGLPRAYFWSAPTNWGEAFSHISGGAMRAGVFRLPDGSTLVGAAGALGQRLVFEFGIVGVLLGAVGCVALLRCAPRVWLGSAWVAGVTALYFASLSSAVQDAPVFALPLVLPWALWIGVGASTVGDWVSVVGSRWAGGGGQGSISAFNLKSVVLLVVLALTLLWGRSRLPYGNKADQWLFRSFGEGALARMAPNAAVLVRWEQGTTLQYLRLIEGQRPDIFVDIVEPENENWQARAHRRYATRPVYIIGGADDGAHLGATRVWGTDYATLFRLP